MPLTSSDIHRLQAKFSAGGYAGGEAAAWRNYYGFRRGLQTAAQMRNIVRRLEMLEAVDSETAQKMEDILEFVSTLGAMGNAVTKFISMGVSTSAAWAVHPVLGGAVLSVQLGAMALGGADRLARVNVKSALEYGAVDVSHPREHPVLDFRGSQGGRAKFEKWFKESRWDRMMDYLGIG